MTTKELRYEIFLQAFTATESGLNMFNDVDAKGNIDLIYDSELPSFIQGLQNMKEEMTALFGIIFPFCLGEMISEYNYIKHCDCCSDEFRDMAEKEMHENFGALQAMLNAYVMGCEVGDRIPSKCAA